jgi:dCMP deaminase
MGWDERWMDMAALVAGWSKDRSRRTSALIVDERQCLVAIGWNGFPRGVNDDIDERHERPAKYKWTEHGERNAIYNAAANGHRVMGCRMYLPWYPCADCARAIIQSGIKEVIAIEPDWFDSVWADDFSVVRSMFKEAKVSVRFLEGKPPKIDSAT